MSNIDGKIYEEAREIRSFLQSSLESQMETSSRGVILLDSINEHLRAIREQKPNEQASADIASGNQNEQQVKTDNPIAGVDLTSLATSLPKLASGLAKFTLTPTSKFISFVKGITLAMTMEGKLKNPKEVTSMFTAFSQMFQALGDNIGSIGRGMVFFGIADKMGAPKKFVDFLTDFLKRELSDTLTSRKTKSMSDSLFVLGEGILKFSVAIALSTPLLLLGLPGLLLLTPAVYLLTFALSKVGKQRKSIDQGADAMVYLGMSFALFSASLLVTRLLEPTDLWMGLGIIALFGVFIVVVNLVNKIGGKNTINDSAKSLVFFSMALVIMSLSLVVTRLVDTTDVLKAGLMVIVLGGAAYLIGYLKKDVMWGAIAMVAVAASLAVAALGIMLYDDVTWDSILKASGVMLGLSIAAFIVGQSKEYVLMGAIGTVIIAASLIVASYGIGMVSKHSWEDIGKAGAIIGGLGIAAVGVGLVGENAILGSIAVILVSASLIVASYGIGMVSKHSWEDIGKAGAIIGGLGIAAFGVGVIGPFAILGAIALMLVGASLIVVSYGIGKLVALDINEVKRDNMLKTIGYLGIVYAGIGITSPLIGLGAMSMIGVGTSLVLIGEGLLKFDKLNIPFDKLTGKDGIIEKVLRAVMNPFKEIGKEALIGGGFFGGSNPVSLGIDAVEGIGDILVDIAAGVQAFASMTFTDSKGKVVSMNETTMGMVSKNIQTVIGAVGTAFAEIGTTNGETGWFSKGLIEKGVDAISGVGDNLVGIAKAVSEFANMTFTDSNGQKVPMKPEMLALVSANIKSVITSLSAALGEIGNDPNAKSSWWFGRSAIEKGKKVVLGIGDSLVSIVSAATGISDIISKKISAESISDMITSLISSMSKYISDPKLIGDIDAASVNTGKLVEISKSIADVGDSSIKIYESISKYPKFNKDFPGYINTMVVSLSSMSKLGLVNVFGIDKLSSGIGIIADKHVQLNKASISISKISDSLSKTFDSINKLSDDKLTKVKDLFDTIVEIDKVNDASLDKKMSVYKDMVESGKQTTNITNQPVSGNVSTKATTNDGGNTSMDKLVQEISMMREDMSKMLSAMMNMASALNKPLLVEIEDGGLNKYMRK